MTYTASVKMDKLFVDHLNSLLAIDNFHDLTDDEMRKIGAKDYDIIPVLRARFDDESYIDIEVCSGSENYYDNVVFYDNNGYSTFFDCEYEICDNVYIVNDNEYIINIIKT